MTFLTHIYFYSFTVYTVQHLCHCKVCIKKEKEETEKNVELYRRLNLLLLLCGN